MKAEMMKRVLLISLTSLVGLAGCHSFKKENVQPPTPLAKDFKPTVQVTRVWETRVGNGASQSGALLRPSVVDGVLYAEAPTASWRRSMQPVARPCGQKVRGPRAGSAGATRSVKMRCMPVVQPSMVICLSSVRWTATSMPSMQKMATHAGKPSCPPKCWLRR